MTIASLQPRLLLIGALVCFGIGMGLLYAGFYKTAPIALLASVLACVFAAIAISARDVDDALRLSKDEDHDQ